MDDETLWLATTLARPVSPKLCIELRNWHREPGALRQALQKAFDGEPQAECPLSRQHLHALPTANTAARVNQALEWQSSSSQHHLLGLDHPLYPRTLSELPDAPLLLYAVGELTALDGPGISIVGSRKASYHGTGHAFEFARRLAESGLSITSGLAVGIDAAAHRGALRASGITIAVAATDASRVYPKQHQALNQEIIDNGGLILHEFPLGTPVRPWCFPQRNRIISGLSHGVLVIEAALPSGTLTTARHALEQGREIMAIPGSIAHREARGCHALIKDGAALVETPDDVLHCLGAQLKHSLDQPEQASLLHELGCPTPGPMSSPLTADEKIVLANMTTEYVSVDILQRATGLPIAQLSATLGTMELKRLIMSATGGRYTRLKT